MISIITAATHLCCRLLTLTLGASPQTKTSRKNTATFPHAKVSALWLYIHLYSPYNMVAQANTGTSEHTTNEKEKK